ncbi:MAG: Crp/Fnr family transcriptional regulator [Deltaproteobacteria bacterium]|nr:Crp/Fnr family transcriptional regulator [Deltaproteobacteria bacterium]
MLKPFVRELEPGEFLFHQNDLADSMIIVLSGLVELVTETGKRPQIITLIEPGQFLGEQTLIKDEPAKRVFGARARSSVRAVELSKKIVDEIQVEHPPLLIDLLKGIFSIASERVGRANQIIAALRTTNNEVRLLSLLLYFAKHTGVRGLRGTDVLMGVSTIHFYLDMSDRDIQEILERCQESGLIMFGAKGVITIPDLSALTAALDTLKAAPPSAQAA